MVVVPRTIYSRLQHLRGLGMSQPSNAQEIHRKVQGYVDQLAVFFRQAAEDIHDRPDAFLWNARRCLECVAHAWLQHRSANHRIDPAKDQIEQFFAQIRSTDRAIFSHMNFIRENANMAVHVQENVPSFDIEFCRDHLFKIIDWFFNESGVSCTEPASIQASRQELRRSPASKEAQHKAQEAAAQKQREDIARLQQERERAQAQSQDAEARYRQLLAEREQWERQRRELDAECRALKDRLAVQPNFSPTPPPVAVVPLVAPHRRSWPRAVAGVGGLGVFVVLGLGAMSATERRAPSPGETVVPSESLSVTPSALLSVSVSIPQPSASVTGATPQPSQPPARRTECPAGMIAMGPLSALQVPPPKRPNWPTAEGPPRPVSVEQFCVDQTPVRSLAYGKCIQEQGCSKPKSVHPKGCNWDWKKPTTLNCLTRSEASQFCAWRGAKVPTVVQWEVAQKSGKIQMDGRTGEWASENFPAPVFHRGPAKKDTGMIFARERSDGMDEGWNQAPLEGPLAQRADVSFRCACDQTDLSCRGPENDLVGRAP
jgi:formylglycine-generating enzyme required for sulfatase activity